VVWEINMMSDTRNEIHEMAGKVEKHIKRCSTFFELALRAYPDLIFCIAHIDGYFKELYGKWEEVLGWSKEELLSRPWIGFVHPDDKEKTIAEGLAMETRDTFKFINRYRCKDGKYKTFEWTCLVWNGNGTSYCLVKVLND
jgi:PAS domain S-box-containing protein